MMCCSSALNNGVLNGSPCFGASKAMVCAQWGCKLGRCLAPLQWPPNADVFDLVGSLLDVDGGCPKTLLSFVCSEMRSSGGLWRVLV